MALLTPDATVYVAGHRGMVGSAIWRRLAEQGYTSLIGHPSGEVDLRDRDATFDAISSARPDAVVLAAAKVGGILANSTYPVEFLTDNVRIQSNVFEAAHAAGVERLLFLGSSCIYPKFAEQPIREESLLTGPLEPSNEAYALAKIAGIIATRSYRSEYGRRWISAMPTNLYGPNDNFDLESSHVLPALIRRFHEARESNAANVTLWGTGTPRREFMHVDDLAAACQVLLERYDDESHVNVGVGEDVTIARLASMIAEIVGYDGELVWDSSKPDGTPRKLLNVSRLTSLGFEPQISLRDGVASTYNWYQSHPA